MPPIWKGAIRFGLVTIPVALVGAESRDELDFDLLDRRDLSPIGYATINKTNGRKVEQSNVIKGFAVAKGRYVTVDDDDFKRASVEATQTLDILQFVERDAIDPRYFERPYFVTPLPRAEHAYGLLRDALAASGRVGVARVVLRSREHLAALLPFGDVLVCDLLRFAHELRDVPRVAAGNARAGGETAIARERRMAEALIDSMTAPWRPEELHDTYREALIRLLRSKAKRGAKPLPPLPEVRPLAPVVDLMALLRQSVEAAAPRGGKRSENRGRAASRPAAASAKRVPAAAPKRPAGGRRRSAR